MEITQEENKHKLQEIAFDISVSIESFARVISNAEADLQEAKSSAKKLIEKIDEYLESQKPEFKVGDYVTLDIRNNKKIAKIDRLNGDTLHGLWYDTESKNIEQDLYFGSVTTVKHSTPNEIAEYEVALTFNKHGRNPFEVKKGDLIRTPIKKNTLIWYPENYTKEGFLDYGWEFLKTAEEINEWLGVSDE